MKTSAFPQRLLPFHNPAELGRCRSMISSDEINSAERALRQLASLETNNQEKIRSLLDLASELRPVAHWGLND